MNIKKSCDFIDFNYQETAQSLSLYYGHEKRNIENDITKILEPRNNKSPSKGSFKKKDKNENKIKFDNSRLLPFSASRNHSSKSRKPFGTKPVKISTPVEDIDAIKPTIYKKVSQLLKTISKTQNISVQNKGSNTMVCLYDNSEDNPPLNEPGDFESEVKPTIKCLIGKNSENVDKISKDNSVRTSLSEISQYLKYTMDKLIKNIKEDVLNTNINVSQEISNVRKLENSNDDYLNVMSSYLDQECSNLLHNKWPHLSLISDDKTEIQNQENLYSETKLKTTDTLDIENKCNLNTESSQDLARNLCCDILIQCTSNAQSFSQMSYNSTDDKIKTTDNANLNNACNDIKLESNVMPSNQNEKHLVSNIFKPKDKLINVYRFVSGIKSSCIKSIGVELDKFTQQAIEEKTEQLNRLLKEEIYSQKRNTRRPQLLDTMSSLSNHDSLVVNDNRIYNASDVTINQRHSTDSNLIIKEMFKQKVRVHRNIHSASFSPEIMSYRTIADHLRKHIYSKSFQFDKNCSGDEKNLENTIGNHALIDKNEQEKKMKPLEETSVSSYKNFANFMIDQIIKENIKKIDGSWINHEEKNISIIERLEMQSEQHVCKGNISNSGDILILDKFPQKGINVEIVNPNINEYVVNIDQLFPPLPGSAVESESGEENDVTDIVNGTNIKKKLTNKTALKNKLGSKRKNLKLKSNSNIEESHDFASKDKRDKKSTYPILPRSKTYSTEYSHSMAAFMVSAIGMGDYNECTRLLKKGFDINLPLKLRSETVKYFEQINLPILHIACLFRRPKLIKLFLEHGANPNYRTDKWFIPLHLILDSERYYYFFACQFFNLIPSIYNFRHIYSQEICIEEMDVIPSLNALIHPDADFDKGSRCNKKVWLVLQSNKVDINITDKYGRTALHNMCLQYKDASSSYKVIRYLLRNGSRINARDVYGHAPLNYALQWKNSRIISEILTSFGAIKVNSTQK